MKYKNRYAVKLMCKVLKISESGYYRWLKNKDKPSKRHLLLVKINEILSEHPDNANYGYDRIHKALEIRGIKVSRNTVYRAMKDGNLIHKARKPHGITKASTEIQDKENLIKRDFTADKPVKKLLTDITEVQCLDGKLYISPIMDCYNGEILTVEMRDNMKKEEVKTIVFRYIFIYYNRIRLYTGNPGCLPPSEYRIRNCEKTAA